MIDESLIREFEEELTAAWRGLDLLIKLEEAVLSEENVTIENFLPLLVNKFRASSVIVLFKEDNVFKITSVFNLNKDLRDKSIPVDKGIIGKVARIQSSRIENNPERLNQDTGLQYLGIKPSSIMATPIKIKNKVEGVFCLFDSKLKDGFPEDDLNFIQAAIGGLAILCLLHFQTQQTRLARLEREAVFAYLASSVAHQFRNILNNMSLSVSILNRRIPHKDAEILKYIDKIKNELERGSKVVNNFLGFARGSKETFQRLSLNNLLEDALNLVRGMAIFQNIEIITEYSSLSEVQVNVDQLREAFLNLINNAAQSMPEGGRLKITTNLNNNYLEVTFADTGVGIPSENIGKIFDYYYTTKPEGYGVGLPFTCRIIKEHHGSIDVESKVGKGTTFKIKLPIEGGID